jgi:hypothetical protein
VRLAGIHVEEGLRLSKHIELIDSFGLALHVYLLNFANLYRFTFDHDWLREGKLPASRVEAADDDAFKILSDLMADLSNLSKDLHAIRLKLQVRMILNPEFIEAEL